MCFGTAIPRFESWRPSQNSLGNEALKPEDKSDIKEQTVFSAAQRPAHSVPDPSCLPTGREAGTTMPHAREGHDFEAITNGKVVWVNGADGMCVGRFSAAGVDVHRTAADQLAGLPQCLDCIHDLPFDEAWPRFQASMLEHHGIVVRDELRPSEREAATALAPSLSGRN